MPNCAVYGCSNTSGRTGNKEKAIYFHQFPKREQSPKRYAKWLKFCKRKTFVPKKSSRICSKHFKSSDFDESQLLKIRLMPHAKLKGPTLKPGAIPTPIDSKTKRKSSSEVRNEEKERKILVDKILQTASAIVRPTALKPDAIHSSIDSNAKRKSSRGVLNEEKTRKPKGKRMLQSAGSIRQIALKLDALPSPIDACMKVKRKSSREVHSQIKRRKVGQTEKSIRIKEVQKVKSIKSEVFDVLNKGIQCELGIESYRNIMFAPSLKSESCSNINLVQSSVILSENIKLETDVVEFYC